MRLPGKEKSIARSLFADRSGRGSGDLSGAGGKAKSTTMVANDEGTVRLTHRSTEPDRVHRQ